MNLLWVDYWCYCVLIIIEFSVSVEDGLFMVVIDFKVKSDNSSIILCIWVNMFNVC